MEILVDWRKRALYQANNLFPRCGCRLRPGNRGRTTFPLRVQTGCDESCSYCTIPASRGPSRSRTVGEVIEEATRLANAGYAELVLTGVHLGAFGRDLRPRSSLVELLRALDQVPGSFRVRISSLEPMDCPRDLITLVAASSRFAPHVHLPLQSGSSAVLKRMRRTYDRERYLRLVDRLRAAIPDPALGTDLIVGFPGETDADFEETLEVVEAVHYDSALTFIFSPRSFASQLDIHLRQ